MTPTHSTLEHSTTYTGKDCVIIENDVSLSITHTEKFHLFPNLQLDVLDVLHLIINILFINKLTNSFPYLLHLLIIFSLFKITKREGWWQPDNEMEANMY